MHCQTRTYLVALLEELWSSCLGHLQRHGWWGVWGKKRKVKEKRTKDEEDGRSTTRAATDLHPTGNFAFRNPNYTFQSSITKCITECLMRNNTRAIVSSYQDIKRVRHPA